MSNTEWKQGYDAGFAAGWKAAKGDNLNYTNFPPVYYGGYKPGEVGTYNFATMNDQSYSVNTTVDYGTVTLNENKKPDLRIV